METESSCVPGNSKYHEEILQLIDILYKCKYLYLIALKMWGGKTQLYIMITNLYRKFPNNTKQVLKFFFMIEILFPKL